MTAATSSNLSRRGFLQASAAAFSLAVTASGAVWAAPEKKYGKDALRGGAVENPLVFVSIAPDGIVTIVSHRAEMGTGIRTSLPMIIADELEADWGRVKVVQSEANEERYGNQNVDGSRTVRHFLVPMRRIGASARHMLEVAAAARWQVPVSQVRAVQHEVVHLPTSRKLGYGELAAEAAKVPVPQGDALRLKETREFRYIGKGEVRAIDLEDIGRGVATYGMDARQSGMVYAVVARPPVVGGKVKSFSAEKALKVPGILKVVEIPIFTGPAVFQPLGGIAVVGSNTWAAMQGRAALEIEWDDGPNAIYTTEAYRQILEAGARAPAKASRDDGAAVAALAKAPGSHKVEAEYYLPHIAHAPMEPPVATAVVRNDGCEIWTSAQNPNNARLAVATRLKLKPEQVTVHQLLLGGGFGRKSKHDYVEEAVIVAQSLPGKPVKLVWTRDDDIRHDYLHTVSLERLEAVVDAKGMPTTWLHRTAAPSMSSLFVAGATGQSPVEAGQTALAMPYRIPNFRVEGAAIPAYTRIGWFRSVANIPHAFAAQCFIAELAHRAGKDHRQFALDLLGPRRKVHASKLSDTWNYGEDPEVYKFDTGRQADVINAVTEAAGWGRKLPKGRGLGMAFSYSFMSYAATVIEVEVNDQGDVHVMAVDMAIDCGPQVNPERIRSQMEGAAIMGLSLATTSEITFENGRVKQSNFHDYEVLRHGASPRTIRTHLVNDNFAAPPGGVGEPPVPPVAPALANAIFAATGKRIRELPIRKVA